MNIFITSPWVPPEWIKAHELEPRGIWAQPHVSEITPGAGVCAYAETVLRQAERNPDSAFIFTTHCDQLRRSFDALTFKAADRIFLFNLPSTCGTSAAAALFADELPRLSRWLMKIGGKAPVSESISRIMSDYRKARDELLNAADWCPAGEYAKAVLGFHWNGRAELPLKPTPASAKGPSRLVRLALVGGPFTAPFWPLLDEIEKAGGNVVLNATEAGERSLGFCDAAADEPVSGVQIEDLNSIFLNRIVDVFQRPNNRLYEWLIQRVRERKIQAILLWHYFGCDLWRAELHTLQEALGLPVLLLEANETGGGLARTRTRIEAFLETLSGVHT